MILTNRLGVTIFSIIILISFVIPYIFMRESPPYILFIFWAIASLISIVLARLSLPQG